MPSQQVVAGSSCATEFFQSLQKWPRLDGDLPPGASVAALSQEVRNYAQSACKYWLKSRPELLPPSHNGALYSRWNHQANDC
jgi:hypothetical protein